MELDESKKKKLSNGIIRNSRNIANDNRFWEWKIGGRWKIHNTSKAVRKMVEQNTLKMYTMVDGLSFIIPCVIDGSVTHAFSFPHFLFLGGCPP